MRSNPLVSVIIPNYNHASFLKKRIESVLNQTYKKFEIIILDDHSTDNSVEIIEKYRGNPYISLIKINEKNSGSTFVQWDYGINNSKGDLIWIAESDDYCDNDFLEKCINAFRFNPNNVLIYTNSVLVNSKEEIIGTYSDENYQIKTYQGEDFIKRKMIYGSAIWNASSAVFRRDCVKNINKDYQSFKACGDRLFWIFLAQLGHVTHINEWKNYFRQHNNKVSPKRLKDGTSLKEEKIIFEFLKKRKYITGIKKLFIKYLYLIKINTVNFENEQLKAEILRFWKLDNIYKRSMLQILGPLYIRFNVYILRKKPI